MAGPYLIGIPLRWGASLLAPSGASSKGPAGWGPTLAHRDKVLGRLRAGRGAGFIPGMIARLKQRWDALGRERFALLAGTVVFVVAVWVFVEMADDAVPGRYLVLEGKILRAFRQPDDLARGI